MTLAWEKDSDGVWKAAAAPGGGKAAVTQEEIIGNAVTINNGDLNVPIGWDTSHGPDSLLDLTDPLLPAVKEDGLYLIALEVTPTEDLTAGGQHEPDLVFDYDSLTLSPDLSAASAPATTAVPRPRVTIAGSWYLSAGATIQVTVSNKDGVAARGFKILPAMIVRIQATHT